ncbi:MAG: hypothetical protein WC505_06065 [Patescibacteria group bacterium]
MPKPSRELERLAQWYRDRPTAFASLPDDQRAALESALKVLDKVIKNTSKEST